MPLPPKGDPRRPLHLAVRSTRVLAGLFIALGSCGLLPMLLYGLRFGRLRGSVFFLLFYLGPGAAYLVFSIYLKQRKFWAVVCALILTSIYLTLTLFGAAMFAYMIVREPARAEDGWMTIPVALLLLVILALAQLVFHLIRSFEAIKYIPPEEQHGFEPIMVEPTEPTGGEGGRA
jgi:hypothetical protein